MSWSMSPASIKGPAAAGAQRCIWVFKWTNTSFNRLVAASCYISLVERFQSILCAIYTLLTHYKWNMKRYSLITVSVACLPTEAFTIRYSTCFISALQLLSLTDFLNVWFCSPFQNLGHFKTTGGRRAWERVGRLDSYTFPSKDVADICTTDTNSSWCARAQVQ